MSFSASVSALTVAALTAAGAASAQQVFSCVDAQGRTLTSDRPILECIDREQRVLSPGGRLQRKLPPSYTASERAAIEAQTRAESDERLRQTEDRQRQRALLIRYPNQGVLDHERAAAVARVDEVVATANERIAVLQAERRKLDADAARHAKGPQRMPASLQHAIDQNDQQLKAQQRYIDEQQQERQRVHQQFDRMQIQLNALWQKPGSGAN